MSELSGRDQRVCDEAPASYDDLRVVFVNCTLKPSSELSHTQALADRSIAILRAVGGEAATIRVVDHHLAPGVQPDMTGHGAERCPMNAMNLLYSLQHLGYVIPPQSDAAWLGEARQGPSYADEGSGGPDNDFTNRDTTFMTWNLLHTARWLQDAGGFPAHGNRASG